MTIRRRVEHADLEAFAGLDHHDDHEITIEYDEAVGMPRRRRATCECGWRGSWRRGKARTQEAIADGDQHMNEET